ncbi:MAG: pyridoxine 5'-phosphate synthase [Cyanobacteriota bacterium]
MITLGVNIDHVATIREARKGIEPDPVTAAAICELAGADCITIHLREDRRHINDRDVRVLAQTIQTRMNLEMACTKEIQDIAIEIKPYSVCLVPEKREEVTTEGGLNISNNKDFLKDYIAKFQEHGIIVSLFIDPDIEQVKASQEVNADFIEIHTGTYANSKKEQDTLKSFNNILESAKLARKLGLRVNAGHGLNYINVHRICTIPDLEELNIGHSIISRAVFVGLDQAVREMKQILDRYNNAIHSGSLN